MLRGHFQRGRPVCVSAQAPAIKVATNAKRTAETLALVPSFILISVLAVKSIDYTLALQKREEFGVVEVEFQG